MELGLLHRELSESAELIRRASGTAHTHAEVLALATVLQSFYNGIENIFRQAARLLDDSVPRGGRWHVQLLDSMATGTASRPAVISEDLRQRLTRYLGFRHLVRHSYAFSFEWKQMAPLALECDEILRKFEAELEQFFQQMQEREQDQ
ncbi:MAG: hypothetical protein ACOC8E_04740 [Planctomycetota bacterium]